MSDLPGKEVSRCYDKLSKYCYRLSKPRQAILDILSHKEKHLNTGQIYKAVSKISPTVGLATIYRNLELLARIGLVWRSDACGDKAMYEIAKRPEESHHHHLICKHCNCVIDYPCSINNEKGFLKEREKKLSRKYNFKIENHCIDFFGLCDKCKKQQMV